MHPGNNAPHTSGNAAQGARGLRRRAIGTASKRLCNAAHRWISWTRSALDPVEMRIRPGSRLCQEDTSEWTCPADPKWYAESTCYVRHTSIPQSLPKRSPTPLATAAAPTAGSAPPAGTDRPCSGSVRVPDDRVLIRRGRSGQASEVGPRSVYPSRRIDGNAGVIADEAAGELDVRIGGLRRDASLAGIAVRGAAECVIEAHRVQVRIVHRRRGGVTRICGVQEAASAGMVACSGYRRVIAGVIADRHLAVIGPDCRVDLVVGARGDLSRGRPRRTVTGGDELDLVVRHP